MPNLSSRLRPSFGKSKKVTRQIYFKIGFNIGLVFFNGDFLFLETVVTDLEHENLKNEIYKIENEINKKTKILKELQA